MPTAATMAAWEAASRPHGPPPPPLTLPPPPLPHRRRWPPDAAPSRRHAAAAAAAHRGAPRSRSRPQARAHPPPKAPAHTAARTPTAMRTTRGATTTTKTRRWRRVRRAASPQQRQSPSPALMTPLRPRGDGPVPVEPPPTAAEAPGPSGRVLANSTCGSGAEDSNSSTCSTHALCSRWRPEAARPRPPAAAAGMYVTLARQWTPLLTSMPHATQSPDEGGRTIAGEAEA